jgi:hypothetical protein
MPAFLCSVARHSAVWSSLLILWGGDGGGGGLWGYVKHPLLLQLSRGIDLGGVLCVGETAGGRYVLLAALEVLRAGLAFI